MVTLLLEPEIKRVYRLNLQYVHTFQLSETHRQSQRSPFRRAVTRPFYCLLIRSILLYFLKR